MSAWQHAVIDDSCDDGIGLPSGPAHEVKPGIIDMARRAGVPIVPYVPVPESCWTFNSWDRFRLPKPFSKIYVYYGAPYLIAPQTPFAAFTGHQVALAGTLAAIEDAHFATDSIKELQNG